ncbi:MAG: hypothetical protein E6J87_16305, partial [Deltaproteobacteria bacterium]
MAGAARGRLAAPDPRRRSRGDGADRGLAAAGDRIPRRPGARAPADLRALHGHSVPVRGPRARGRDRPPAPRPAGPPRGGGAASRAGLTDMRIACARVADLPLAAELRAHPELRGRPLAIAEGTGARAELLCVSRAAARSGVRAGISTAHARSLCAGLAVRVASPALEQAARDALLDAAFACSPRAALAARSGGAFATEAAVFADAAGTGALFRSEAGFATALAARIGALGLPADVAVASSRDAARIAVRQLASELTSCGGATEVDAGGRVLALPPDRERSFLAPLPIDLLDPGDALAEALTRFGIRTVRDLLALPRRGLATRLGAGALELLRVARGEAVSVPLPEARDLHLVEAIDLEAPIDRLEPLLFVLQGLLSRLLERLGARHLGCGDLDLSLELADGARDARRIGVA